MHPGAFLAGHVIDNRKWVEAWEAESSPSIAIRRWLEHGAGVRVSLPSRWGAEAVPTLPRVPGAFDESPWGRVNVREAALDRGRPKASKRGAPASGRNPPQLCSSFRPP